MTRVSVNPDLLRWARERARLETANLVVRFPKLMEWETQKAQPTLRQLEDYARATHAPIGYFFLPEPPQEPLPIPDFRTVAGRVVTRPSPNLLDMIYICQERQSWYRDFALVTGRERLTFIGSLTIQTPAAEAAVRMRTALGFDLAAQRESPTWTDARRKFVEQADQLGILVMISGVVMNNNMRHLDPGEFRGFALSDSLAPLVFINGADSKAAQMFTLAHELAHLWLGESALSDAGANSAPAQAIERWCNQVAAELLVPITELRSELRADETLEFSLARLARQFKVSTLVVLRRLFDAGTITRATFNNAYAAELSRIAAVTANAEAGGGNFYATTRTRVSKRFGRALVESTLEGRTLYRDAFRMLGIAKTATFNEFGRSLGFAI